MSKFELDDLNLSIKTINKKYEKVSKIPLTDPILSHFMDSVNILFVSLKENNCDWKINDNFLLMNVIQGGLIFTRKLKKMTTENKKRMVLSLILNVLEKQVKEVPKLMELKEKIVEGIETIVEPALELAMMTQNNEFKIPKNCVVNLFKLCRN